MFEKIGQSLFPTLHRVLCTTPNSFYFSFNIAAVADWIERERLREIQRVYFLWFQITSVIWLLLWWKIYECYILGIFCLGHFYLKYTIIHVGICIIKYTKIRPKQIPRVNRKLLSIIHEHKNVHSCVCKFCLKTIILFFVFLVLCHAVWTFSTRTAHVVQYAGTSYGRLWWRSQRRHATTYKNKTRSQIIIK